MECQIIEYNENMPFYIHNITREGIVDKGGGIKNVLEHWHPEMEIVYTFAGHARHYIDGQVYVEEPGGLLVTNSESIHKIISDDNVEKEQEIIASVLIVKYPFVKQLVPDIHNMYFLSEPDVDMTVITPIMKELSLYADGRRKLEPYEVLHLTGMVYELFYRLCKTALVQKESIMPVNTQKNLERLRGIMEYVGEHYTEPVEQKEVAKRFYFTKEYFSRFFKKNTGMTFKEYLIRYRVCLAREEILNTDKTMLEIAMNNGFSDSRGLIAAFKNVYGVTPLQFRKQADRKQDNLT